jgi:hypothetical protein
MLKRPEFLIDCKKVRGIPVGRFYIPFRFKDIPFYPSYLLQEKSYANGDRVLWFIAPISEYCRLARLYPHHSRSDYIFYLLRSASTFFSLLKPPFRNR